MPDPNSFTYELFQREDSEPMTRLLGEVFARRDPPAVAVGLRPAEFETLVRLCCPRAAEEGITIVARRSGQPEMIGAMLCEEYGSPMPEGMDALSPKFDPIFDILGRLDTEYRANHWKGQKSIHMFLLGVAESAAGVGVAQQLVSRCLENASRLGYQLAVTEATNLTSQHVFRKLGFVERVTRPYAGHRFNGQAMFDSIANHGGPILMDRVLDLSAPSYQP